MKKLDLTAFKLMSVINKEISAAYLEQHGEPCPVVTRIMNTVIKACNDIANEIAKPYLPAVPDSGIKTWLACDETGESSMYLIYNCYPDRFMIRNYFSGLTFPVNHITKPADYSDFIRCVKALAAVPECIPHLKRLATMDNNIFWTHFYNQRDLITGSTYGLPPDTTLYAVYAACAGVPGENDDEKI
ncbi:hypothetical protein [Morganella phage Mecenats66]|nr:hypothetical protein [Morganella phage Mecenats66]